MAGLLQPPQEVPQEALQQAPPQEVQQNPEQMPPEQPEEEISEEGSPQFGQAMQFAYAALYKNNAGKNVVASVSKAQDKADTLANMTYEIASVATERIEGFPEEDLVLLASELLTEVAEIAESAGVKIESAEIGEAFKIMLLRFMGEMGANTAELQAAMDKFTPEMMQSAYDYVGTEDDANV